jgi:hypothetical protein
MKQTILMLGVCAFLGACGSDSSGGGAATGGSAGAATGGSAGASTGGAAGSGGSSTGGSGGGVSCTSATEALLNPIDEVSTGTVEILEDLPSSNLIYVNATAGGINQAGSNPYIYLKLSDTTRVDITDPAALEAQSWDMALKRDVIRSNSGDSGPGAGGATRISGKPFDQVTLTDAASFDVDEFLDDQCNAITDATGKPQTAFTDWYNYDDATMHVSPKPLVWVVKGADGATHFKLEILDYYSLPDGGTGQAGANYKIRVAPL